MSKDTVNVNGKAKANNTYDAIVIGSGISGGWAAKELTEAGLKTIMLERGRNFEHLKDDKSAGKDPWDFEHRGNVTQSQRTHRAAGPFYGAGKATAGAILSLRQTRRTGGRSTGLYVIKTWRHGTII